VPEANTAVMMVQANARHVLWESSVKQGQPHVAFVPLGHSQLILQRIAGFVKLELGAVSVPRAAPSVNLAHGAQLGRLVVQIVLLEPSFRALMPNA